MFKSKKLVTLINSFSKGFASSNPLTAQHSANSLKEGIRFENQNKTWSFDEIEKHSNAFAFGLTELGYSAGDKVVLLLEKSSTSEVVVSQIGAAKAGITLVTVRPSSKEELATVLAESKSKGLLFSPNAKLGQETYSDALQSVIPEMKNSDVGSLISSSKFANLKHLIHTGFYSVPGALKFKHVLFYAGKKYNTIKLPEFGTKNIALSVWNGSKLTDYSFESLLAQGNEFRKSHGVGEGDAVVIAGDVRFPFTYSVGALNTLVNGNYLVLTGNQKLSDVEKVLGFYKNSVVLIDGDHFSEGSQPALNSANLAGVKKVVVSSVKSNVNQNAFTSLFGGKSVAFASAI